MSAKSNFPDSINESLTELPALGMDVFDLVEDFRRYYTYTLGRDRHCRSRHYAYFALVLILRDRSYNVV